MTTRTQEEQSFINALLDELVKIGGVEESVAKAAAVSLKNSDLAKTPEGKAYLEHRKARINYEKENKPSPLLDVGTLMSSSFLGGMAGFGAGRLLNVKPKGIAEDVLVYLGSGLGTIPGGYVVNARHNEYGKGREPFAARERDARKAFLDTLGPSEEKKAAVSDEEAQKSLDRYRALEKNKPGGAQMGRYALVGAAAGPAMGALSNAIRGGHDPSKGISYAGHLLGARTPGAKGMLRGAAASAVQGAIGSGAIPLVRAALDRRAERGTLEKYVKERTTSPQPVEKDSAAFANTPSKGWSGEGAVDLVKAGFSTSAYDAGLGSPRFQQVSQVPGFRAPSLQRVAQEQPQQIVEKLGAAVTPEGRLNAAKRVGLPRISAPPGPSVAQIAKPVGFGKPAAGATKNGI